MRVLNLLATGKSGGIETLCNNIDKYSDIDNYWMFLFDKGEITEQMQARNPNRVFFLGYKKCELLRFISTINNTIKEYKIEIVTIHHGGTYCNLVYYLLKKMNKKIKFVRYLHSCYQDEFYLNNNFLYDRINLLCLEKALQRSDLIISVSNAVKKSFDNKFKLQNKRRIVIYNGIDINFFKERKKKVKGQTIRIIYIGRLVKVKGIERLIKAMYYCVYKKKLDVKLTIVGDGIERNNLENVANELNLEKNIEFVGTQSDVIKYLDKSDVFVYPSIWNEAFGISVVEAMARGCIPIVSNRGGLLEIITDKMNGFILENDSEKLLADKIEEIYYMKDKEKIILNAIRTSKKFSINNTIKCLNKAYVELLNRD